MKVQPDREVTIYALKREGEAAPYYIGQTVDVEKRRRQHRVKPSEIIELDKVIAANAHAMEREWVRRSLALGIHLRNDIYNTARKRNYITRPVVTFSHAPSGVIYCRLVLKQGPNTIANYSLRCDAKRDDLASVCKAISDMKQWLRDMGCPEMAHRPQEWAQGRFDIGKLPSES